MPPWGRPSSSGTGSRRARDQWYQQRRRWEEHGRFEELLSDNPDDDDLYDPRPETWETRPPPRRTVSVERFFTGIDADVRSRAKRQVTYAERAGSSAEEETDVDEPDSEGMQLALREKEARLVQMAMERIRRAQMKGKSNVRLTPLEVEALERERRRARSQAKGTGRAVEPSRVRSRRSTLSDHASDGGRYAGSPTASHSTGRAVAKPVYDPESPPYLPGEMPPGYVLHHQPEADGTYPTPEYRSPRRKRSSNPLSRPGSSYSSQTRVPPSGLPQDPRQPTRYFSFPETTHSPSKAGNVHPRVSAQSSLPLETDWIPPPRRTGSRSSVQAAYPVDSLQSSTYPLPPSSYYLVPTPGGHPDPMNLQYGPIRRHPAPSGLTSHLYPVHQRRGFTAGPDPVLAGRSHVPGSLGYEEGYHEEGNLGEEEDETPSKEHEDVEDVERNDLEREDEDGEIDDELDEDNGRLPILPSSPPRANVGRRNLRRRRT